MRPGMMPIFALPGEMTPGQFGPISVDFDDFTISQTFTMSSVRYALGDADDQRDIAGRSL